MLLFTKNVLAVVIAIAVLTFSFGFFVSVVIVCSIFVGTKDTAKHHLSRSDDKFVENNVHCLEELL